MYIDKCDYVNLCHYKKKRYLIFLIIHFFDFKGYTINALNIIQNNILENFFN